MLPDPVVDEAARRLDHPFGERFGIPDLGPVVPALAFDAAVRSLPAEPGHRTVVSRDEGLDDADRKSLADLHPAIAGATARGMPAGRRLLLGSLLPALHRWPGIGRRLPLMVTLHLATS
ncbi:MAG: hypothetical protein ACREQM_00025 [Candidatus Dormibacteraceae bacterium]